MTVYMTPAPDKRTAGRPAPSCRTAHRVGRWTTRGFRQRPHSASGQADRQTGSGGLPVGFVGSDLQIDMCGLGNADLRHCSASREPWECVWKDAVFVRMLVMGVLDRRIEADSG